MKVFRVSRSPFLLVPGQGLGLANGPNGLVLRPDRSKEPVEFTSLGGRSRNGHGDGDETRP